MPGKLLRSCAKCGAPFEPKSAAHRHCPRHVQHGNQGRSPTTRSRPSSSTERERIAAEVLAGDPPCARRIPGVCTGKATTVGHIVPAADGGTWERSNLQPECAECNFTQGGQLAHGVSRESTGHTAALPMRHGGGAAATPGQRILH